MARLSPAQTRLIQHLAAGTWPKKQGGIFETIDALTRLGLVEYLPVEGKTHTQLTLTAAGRAALEIRRDA